MKSVSTDRPDNSKAQNNGLAVIAYKLLTNVFFRKYDTFHTSMNVPIEKNRPSADITSTEVGMRLRE